MSAPFVLTCAIVNDFPNYCIYSDGTCRNIKTGRILKPQILCKNAKNKRYYYSLCNKFGVKKILRYRLIGLNLIPNPFNFYITTREIGDSIIMIIPMVHLSLQEVKPPLIQVPRPM